MWLYMRLCMCKGWCVVLLLLHRRSWHRWSRELSKSLQHHGQRLSADLQQHLQQLDMIELGKQLCNFATGMKSKANQAIFLKQDD